MGLDMFLTGEKYLNEYVEESKKLSEKLGKNFKDIPFRIEKIVFDIGYWRKANHIHKWFVDNVQDGEDNCEKYYVSDDDLKELLKVCKEVLEDKSKAEELLPTQSGFFFGGTQYDKYYFEQIKYTIEIIEKALSVDDLEYCYQSSW